MRKGIYMSLGILALVAVGCAPATDSKQYSTASPPAAVRDVQKGLVPNVDAGVPLAASTDPKQWNMLVASHVYPSRPLSRY